MATSGWVMVRPWVAVVGGAFAGWFVGGLTDFSSPTACFGLVPAAFALAIHLPRPSVNAALLGVLADVLCLVTAGVLALAQGG